MVTRRTQREPKNQTKVRGMTSTSGTDWIKVQQGKRVVYIPHGEFMTSQSDVKSRLSAGKIVLIASDWQNLIAKVRSAKFRPRPLVDRVGWTDPYFAMPDTRVFGPATSKPTAVFRGDSKKCARAGTLQGWRREVAEIVDGQSLPMFMLMAAFVAPLLKLTRRTGNFGFELTGPPGTGKSTVLYLMASVAGGAVNGSGENYWNTCNTTVNALEKKALQHIDLPLLLDDATAFAGEDNSSTKGNKFKLFVMNLSLGETKDRWTDTDGPTRFRLMYAITSNTALADVIANVATNEVGAAADRLMTLDTGLLNHGTFDFIPAEYADETEFARKLVEGLSAEYGTALPAFLEQLVQHRADDEAGLRAGIQNRIDQFLVKVQVNRANASDVRVGEAFGLVMTAGLLAQRYGVLPKSFDCETAAVSAYCLYQASTARSSFEDRLLAYAADQGVIDLNATYRKDLTLAEFEDVPGVFRGRPGKNREFLVHPRTFRRAFPDWRRMLKDSSVAALLETEKPHNTIKRALIRGDKTGRRVYCFRLESGSL